MPPASAHKYTTASILILCALVLALAWWCYTEPVIIFILVGFAIILFIETRFTRNHYRRLSASRPDDNLCTFARSFDCREVDTWLIRAVYDALQDQIKDKNGIPFPIRPTDLLREDLKIDDEDLDDMAVDIANRAGYDLNEVNENPLYGKVRTVYDMIIFFTHQLKIREDAEHAPPVQASPH